MNDLSQTGIVFNIQKFSIHDGRGIRTTVFVTGCPLACKWCSNPESQTKIPIVMLNAPNCLHCGACRGSCAIKAIDYSLHGYINRQLCTNCRKCAEVCCAGALVVSGKVVTVAEVLRELKKDAIHYRRSRGGITISGGEPLGQAEFVAALLKASKRQGWHTAIETTGCGLQESIEKVLPYVDLVLLDIKQMSPELHQKGTGITNTFILQNVIKIAQMSKQLIVRVPVIPGFNADEKSISLIVEFAKTMRGVQEIHLLPYHKLSANKYLALGKKLNHDVELLTPAEINVFKQIVERNGFHCSVGGG